MNIEKITKVVAKILEITHWVAAALMAAAAVCSAAAPQWVNHFVGIDAKENVAELSVYGFEIAADFSGNSVDTKTFIIFAIGAVIILSLMAMIFRNLNLIVKKSENSTPFQKDNIRMLREIGIFSISIPVAGLIMSIIARIAIGIEAAETSTNIDGFIMGIIVLCLTQFFTHGVKLEKEVDGLL